jgi:hypothetical protein
MKDTQTPTVALAERLCRPQRVGMFGRRGVGKTTLLTMLYREAVGGRLPGLRLAAADARTADYLSDKIAQLEAGQPLPATLGETDLRFHLYHQGRRLELLVKDYQGEHVAVGRAEPIRDFLRDCDAVWLCLDDPPGASVADRLRAQQEVEQLVEDYLATRPPEAPHRPMAFVLTKADQHGPPEEADGVAGRVAPRFDMARHALATHCPSHALFAVSSLGGPIGGAGFAPRPAGLGGPLAWLADALQAQDEARLAVLWRAAARDVSLLERCVAVYARRYPEAPAAAAYRRSVRALRRDHLRRRVLATAAAASALLLGLRGYDAYGEYRARQFAEAHADDPEAARAAWAGFRAWHPTRNLLRPAAAAAEAETLRDLDTRAEQQRCDGRLVELRRQAADADADPEAVWQSFQRFHADYPAREVAGDLAGLRERIKARRDGERARQARTALAELERFEAEADLPTLLARADRLLREHADTPVAAEIRRHRAAYLARIDDRAIDAARAYSARSPLNFHTRREQYQTYLDHHPTGAHAREAAEALAAIEAEWDRHDFRAVRDHFLARPGDIAELATRCRAYLAAHPQGHYRENATELLKWGERVSQDGEYRVVLRGGNFERRIAWWLSRGPDLSVEIEVNGIRYGPSTIIKNRYDPDWDYEFPRRVHWKLGEPVRIRVFDHDYWRRQVVEVASADGDLLAMRLLCGEARSGDNLLRFESDFAMPTLPKLE